MNYDIDIITTIKAIIAIKNKYIKDVNNLTWELAQDLDILNQMDSAGYNKLNKFKEKLKEAKQKSLKIKELYNKISVLDELLEPILKNNTNNNPIINIILNIYKDLINEYNTTKEKYIIELNKIDRKLDSFSCDLLKQALIFEYFQNKNNSTYNKEINYKKTLDTCIAMYTIIHSSQLYLLNFLISGKSALDKFDIKTQKEVIAFYEENNFLQMINELSIIISKAKNTFGYLSEHYKQEYGQKLII